MYSGITNVGEILPQKDMTEFRGRISTHKANKLPKHEEKHANKKLSIPQRIKKGFFSQKQVIHK